MNEGWFAVIGAAIGVLGGLVPAHVNQRSENHRRARAEARQIVSDVVEAAVALELAAVKVMDRGLNPLQEPAPTDELLRTLHYDYLEKVAHAERVARLAGLMYPDLREAAHGLLTTAGLPHEVLTEPIDDHHDRQLGARATFADAAHELLRRPPGWRARLRRPSRQADE